MRRVLIASLLLALGTASFAEASSLPELRSGERPGPPLLYEEPPTAPQLTLARPFRADPLLVSGTDAYRDGEYLYQDYVFDDRGADTVEGVGTSPERNPEGTFSPTAGDVLYPTAPRFAGNAADLVELRAKPTRRAVVYRATLNTAKDADTAVVGIGIDTDREGTEQRAWPNGAGVSSPGLDGFITAWGVDGEVKDFDTGRTRSLPAGAVDIDLRTNQMTIRVPREQMDPDGATWRYVAGVGLWNAERDRWKRVPAEDSPTRNQPASGDGAEDAPAVLNLAFRFDEPQLKSQVGSIDQPTPTTPAPYTTFPGIGNWFEDKQAFALSQEEPSTEGSTGGVEWDFSAEIDFARLSAGADEDLHPPGRQQARLISSSLDLPEGVTTDFPQFGGALQPYMLTVPESYRRSDPSGLTFSLHSLGGAYTQFGVFSPNQLEQFGDDRDDLVATPLGRGPDGWYIDEAEVDFFEVWRDVADNFRLDSERVALSGYSMGGYGTYRLGVFYPDLFGRAFTTVGPPGMGIWLGPPTDPSGGADTLTFPLLENTRWLPYLNWVEASDDLVPYPGPRAQQRRFDRLELRSSLTTFSPGEHFTLAILDEWDAARDFLGGARVLRNPPRVNYAFFPSADARGLGIRHDHAYWVSDLRTRDASGDPETDPARSEIDARSLAYGLGEPRTEQFTTTNPDAGPPQANTIEGTRWTGIPRRPKKNSLALTLANLSRATVDGRRARLEGDRPLCVNIRSDGAGRVRLNLPLPADATVERGCGRLSPSGAGNEAASAVGPSGGGSFRAAAAADSGRTAARGSSVEIDGDGATFEVADGEREYLIAAAGSAPGGGDTDGGPGGSSGDGGDADGPAGGDSAGTAGAAGGGAAADVGAAADSTSDGGGGSLPFTGLALAILALAGLVSLVAGRHLRRISR